MSYKYLTPSSDQQLKLLYDDLGTDEQSLKNGAKYLMEWLEKQPHLPSIKDENMLINYIIASKNSLEMTKENLELKFTLKALVPEIAQDRDPLSEEYRNFVKSVAWLPLPKLTPEGYRVIIFRVLEPLKQNTNIISVGSILKAQSIVADVISKTDRVRGLILITDYEHTKEHIAQMLPHVDFNDLISKASKMKKWNKGNIVFIKKFYAIHVPAMLQPLFAIGEGMLKPKLRKRITIWKKSPTELAQELPKNILPPIYGGDERPLEELRDQFYEYVLQFREWLSTEASLVADLSKKPADAKLTREIEEFNLAGSFRTLSID